MTSALDSLKEKLTPQATAMLAASTPATEVPVSNPLKRLYKSSTYSATVITPKGRKVIFHRNMYATDDKEIIAYLDSELSQKPVGLPGISIDPQEMYMDPEKYDPLSALKNKMRREILEEMATATKNSHKDMGSYIPGALNPASSTDIQAVAAGAGPAFKPVK